VATRGNDSGRGSERSPLRTIEEAVRRAGRGDTVVVHAGSYHESVKVERATGVTVMAAPGASVWLDGSREVRSWTAVDRFWVADGWTAQFDSSPTYSWGAPDNTSPGWQFVDPQHPLAAHPDQVWIDDVPQRQVGLIADVRPGTFYVDEDSDRLYLGSDPTGREVRASDIAKGLSIRAAGTKVLGIGVRRFASSVPHMGSVTVEAPRVRLADMTIQQNATTGLHVLGQRARITRVTLLDNGMMGLTTNGADDLRLDRLHVAGNNRERFNPSPAAGGVKIGRSTGVVVRNSVFDRNRGTGLWFDESVLGISVLGSRLTRNLAHGISLELSGRALVAGNVLAHNGGAGLKVNDTSDVAVWNNTFTGNDREINIVQDDRDIDSQGSYLDDSLPLSFRNGPVVIGNNVLAQTARRSGCLICVEDYSGRMSAEDMRVSVSGNLYQRPDTDRPEHLVLWSRGAGTQTFASLRGFQEATGQELAGQLLTGVRVLRRGARVTDLVDELAGTIARRLPRRVAAALGVPQDARRLGAW
jgi:parallel beta-helix repeat protein